MLGDFLALTVPLLMGVGFACLWLASRTRHFRLWYILMEVLGLVVSGGLVAYSFASALPIYTVLLIGACALWFMECVIVGIWLLSR